MKRVIALVMGLMILLGGATACSSSSSSTPAATSASRDGVQHRYPDRFPVDSLVCERRDPEDPQDPVAGGSSPDLRGVPPLPVQTLQGWGVPQGRQRTDQGNHQGWIGDRSDRQAARTQKRRRRPDLVNFVPSIDNIKASLSNLANKIKGGTATSSDADSTNSLFEQLKSGTGFTSPSNSSLPGLG